MMMMMMSLMKIPRQSTVHWCNLEELRREEEARAAANGAGDQDLEVDHVVVVDEVDGDHVVDVDYDEDEVDHDETIMIMMPRWPMSLTTEDIGSSLHDDNDYHYMMMIINIGIIYMI